MQVEMDFERPAPPGWGHDERSLVKLPFTLVGRRGQSAPDKLEAEWQGKANGKPTTLYKKVTAPGEYGLPEYPAEQLYVALLYHSAQGNFLSKRVRAVPLRLMQLMNWTPNGDAYQRLERSLHQLASVYIETNAFWDDKNKTYVKGGFGILQSWKMVDDEKEGRLEVTWNEELFNHFSKGRFKHLDVHTYYALSSNLAQRLYRWVDEALWPSGKTQIDLRHLAHNRLEISRKRKYKSKIVESLTPALKELESEGVFTWEIAKSQTLSGWKIVFYANEEKHSSRDIEAWLNRQPGRRKKRLIRQAVNLLDPYNRSAWNKHKQKATGAWKKILENIEDILRVEELEARDQRQH